jgi:hypothetical protein
MWLPITGKTSKGKKPQGRQPFSEDDILLVGGFRMADSGGERKARRGSLEKQLTSRAPGEAKTSKVMPTSSIEA